VVICSKKYSPLARRKWIGTAEISEHPLILFKEGGATHSLLEGFFRETGIYARIAMESESVATIVPLVAINLGISIVPFPAVPVRGELHCLRIRNSPPVRELGLIYPRSEHPAKIVLEIIRLCQMCVKETGAGWSI